MQIKTVTNQEEGWEKKERAVININSEKGLILGRDCAYNSLPPRTQMRSPGEFLWLPTNHVWVILWVKDSTTVPDPNLTCMVHSLCLTYLPCTCAHAQQGTRSHDVHHHSSHNSHKTGPRTASACFTQTVHLYTYHMGYKSAGYIALANENGTQSTFLLLSLMIQLLYKTRLQSFRYILFVSSEGGWFEWHWGKISLNSAKTKRGRVFTASLLLEFGRPYFTFMEVAVWEYHAHPQWSEL